MNLYHYLRRSPRQLHVADYAINTLNDLKKNDFSTNQKKVSDIIHYTIGCNDSKCRLQYKKENNNFRKKLVSTCCDEIVIHEPTIDNLGVISELARDASDLGLPVRIILKNVNDTILKNLRLSHQNGVWQMVLDPRPGPIKLGIKRLVDIIVSSLLLIILSPLMAIIAIIIKITSPGPIIFSQERIGKNHRIFKIHKFRSMVQQAEDLKPKILHLNEQDGPVFKIQNDPRITTFGYWIRHWSLDELPQLWNVLTGSMSLVGPRPPLADEVNQYEWSYRKRLSVKPGLTCIWQISGRSNIPFSQWMEMDHSYIDKWSLWLDLKILLQTIPAVLIGKGAS